MVQEGCIQAELCGPRKIFFMILHLCCFQNHANKVFCKKKCWKQGRHKENSKSYTKLTKLPLWCIHSFSLTGLWGRKTHGTAARSNMLKRAWNEKMAIGTGKRAKWANTITKNAHLETVWGSKKWIFWLKSLEVVLQKYAPRSNRNNNFEKKWCKKWFEALQA